MAISKLTVSNSRQDSHLYDFSSVPQAVREFLRINPEFDSCLKSKTAAGDSNITATKMLYKFLRKCDMKPKLLMGSTFVKKLVEPCIQLRHEVAEYGEHYVCQHLTHGVVRVNDLVVDLTHLRLGDDYLPSTYPFRLFVDCWKHVTDVSHVANMGLDDVRELMRAAPRLALASSSGDFMDPSTYTWFKFKGTRKLSVAAQNNKTLALSPNMLYGVREFNSTYDRIMVVVDGKATLYSVEIPKSDRTMAKSVKYRGKIPTVVIKPITVKAKPVQKIAKTTVPVFKTPIDTVDDESPDHSVYLKGVPIHDEDYFDDHDTVRHFQHNTYQE